MDLEVRKELNEVIEKLTHSGEANLDQKLLKRVKTLCKSSELAVRTVYEVLLQHLSKRHAEVRLSAFQVCDELYRRSHTFRELVADNFQKIIVLVCGVDVQEPLPPPKQAAEELRKQSLLAIKNWMEKYGEGYPKLKLGYQYLKYNKKVDFESLVAESEGEIRMREERERRNRAFLEQRLKEIGQEFKDQLPDIHTCIKEMESCFQILMPSFDLQSDSSTNNHGTEVFVNRCNSSSSASFVSLVDSEEEKEKLEEEEEREGQEDSITSEGLKTDSPFKQNSTLGIDRKPDSDITSEKENESDSESEVEWEEVGMGLEESEHGDVGTEGEGSSFSAHGMIGSGWSMTIEVPEMVRVVEEEDNESLVAVLKERHKMAKETYLKRVNKWIEWFTKGSKESLLKQAIDLKELLMATCDKYNELNIVGNQEESEENEKLVEEERVSKLRPLLSPTREGSGLFSSHEGAVRGLQDHMMLDPTTPQAQVLAASKKKEVVQHLKGTSSTTTSGSCTSVNRDDIPVIPFDVDLINWTSSKAPEPTVASIGSLNQFWCEDKDISISEDHKNSLKCRVISFPGQFQPITKSCRAPLKNGELCPRKDRYKCPFHGPIVPRDEFGNPVLELGSTPTTSSLARGGDMAKGTQDEKQKKEKRKGQKRKKTVKHPGLTDLKKLKDTPQMRIEKRIFNKRALKRIGHKMDSADQKRRTDKFSDNFNYALRK